MALLEVEEVHTYYGNIHALKGVSLRVEEGEIVALIGANGAGKSTTLRTICGLVRPRQGAIRLRGEAITGLPPHRIVQRGLSQVPEGRRIFSRLSVRENLELGAYARRDGDVAADMARVLAYFPQLESRQGQPGGTLSGGEQQMLAIGRALMSRPRILLLDEPSMGLAPLLVRAIFRILEEINGDGTTVLLVEQNARAALRVAHRGYVMQTGRIVLQDTAERLRQEETVRKTYLGEA